MRPNFVLPLPRFVLHPFTAAFIAAVHVYLAYGHLSKLFGGEVHDGMQIGRTSCSNFLANTFRVLLTAAAYVLMQELRLHLTPTRHARAQVSTLREHFLKLGAQVVVSVRRIVLHLPRSFPYRDTFHRLALRLGAQSG
jgi:hypothetical protein